MYHFRRILFKNIEDLCIKNVSKTQTRSLYEQFRSGNLEMENKKIEMQRKGTEIEMMKKDVKTFKANLKWGVENFNDNVLCMMAADRNKSTKFQDREVVKFWDFNQANNGAISSYPMQYKQDSLNDMNNWYVTCDSDYDHGYSKASLGVSPAGYALFSGYLDTTLPKNGVNSRAGFAFLGTYKNVRQEITDSMTVDLSDMTHVCMRVRGDGRRYLILFDTSAKMDITWFDRYQFMIYTHGGPYWQDVKIPLSKFYFHYQTAVQDEQTIFHPETIKSIGILAADIFSGPFRLEIDYIGFMSDSQWNDDLDYEGHYHESAYLKSIR